MSVLERGEYVMADADFGGARKSYDEHRVLHRIDFML